MAKQFDPRRAQPNEAFEYADAAGTLHSFSADDDGVIHPKSAEEVAVLDSRDTPVARKVQQAERAEGTDS